MTWLKVKEVAELLGMTERGVRKSATQLNKYVYCHVDGIGQGGKQILIALESLPQEAQDTYNGKEREVKNSTYMRLTADQRKKVDFKLSVVLKYREFKREYTKADKMTEFLKQYNEQAESTLTKRQINHWEHKYEREGINGLVDRRGGYNKGCSNIPDEVWKTFLALYLKESKPTKEQCYRMIVDYFPTLEIPHISAFTRKLEGLGKDALILGRDGMKAYNDNVLPTMQIDYDKIYSNMQWVADHHIFDVLVVDESGHVFRPWLSGWFDRRSRFIVGYVVNKIPPNSDIVLDSFAKACHKCGIPDETLLDNGKDYKVYDLFNNDFALSVTNQMGIKVTNAIPFNAKAKPIERLFGTLEGTYCKHLTSYIGNDPKKRPEKMKKVNEKLKEIAMPYNEFIEFVDNMIKTYNNSPHSGRGMNNRTPIEVYKNSFKKPLRMVKTDDILNLFLMRTTKSLKVGKNGIRIPEIGERYEDIKLFEFFGKNVFARYNSDDLKQVYVFTEQDEFVCIAECKKFVDLGVDAEVTKQTIRELNKRKKEIREFTKSQMGIGVKEPTIEDYVKNKASKADEFNAEEQRQVIPIQIQKHKHLKEIEEEKQRKGLDKKTEEAQETTKSQRDIDKALAQLFAKAGGQ